jgi:alanine racemase
MTLHDRSVRAAEPASGEPDQGEAGGILTIDLAAIEANWKTLAEMALPAECAAVVKGNAYGCGLERVSRKLVTAGCRTFFVTDLMEARRVRTVAPTAAVYVLNGITSGSAQALADGSFRPVLNSLAELAEWDAFVAEKGWAGGAALQVDTGMNRLGVTPDEAIALASRTQADRQGFSLVMSHLACADTPNHPMNDRQIRAFREVRIPYRGIPSSLANSSGMFLGGPVFCDLVRPGVALYGVNPTPGKQNPMRRVIELKARIAQVRTVGRGETVGYGATWTAGRPSRIAILAVGYADGFLRSAAALKGKPPAQVVIAARRCPVAGRVSMDLIAADVTELPEGAVHRSDFATLIGDGITIDEVAASMGTIAYEVLTNLGRRYHRVYTGA